MSPGVYRPIEELVEVSKSPGSTIICGRKRWPEGMGQPRFCAKTLNLRAWSEWCKAHFQHYLITLKYDGPWFDRGWRGNLSGCEWATMYYLGFAERMPEGFVYDGPTPLERAKVTY